MADGLAAFLKPLGLGSYLDTFREEEINDVALLKSMGEDMLRESMEEIGMTSEHVETLAKAVFGGGAPAAKDDDSLALEDNADDDEPLALEENDDEGGLELEENATAPAAVSPGKAAPPPAAAPTVPAAPAAHIRPDACARRGRLRREPAVEPTRGETA